MPTIASTQDNEKRGESLAEFEIENLSQTSLEKEEPNERKTPTISDKEIEGVKIDDRRKKADEATIDLEGDGQT